MNQSSHLPTFVSRAATVAGLIGLLVGFGISIHNKDTFGISLLRTACFGVAFAWGTKRLAIIILRSWLETKLEGIEKDRIAAKTAKEAEEKKAGKKK